jgi:ribosomal protein S18 acetylase RimI-like enzyme
VNITAGGADLLDQIGPLWLELRSHHASLDPVWRDGLLAANFDDRKAGLLAKSAGGEILVLLARSGDHPANVIAYCVCTVTAAGEGEVDSLFVAESHRRRGIGDVLMSRAMAWLAGRATRSLAVEVMACNTDALRLYERYGFRQRTVRILHIIRPDPAQSRSAGRRQSTIGPPTSGKYFPTSGRTTSACQASPGFHDAPIQHPQKKPAPTASSFSTR